MEKEKLYEELLKSLKVAITNSSVYFKEHPLFIQSVEDLKNKIEKTFSVLEPLKIGFSADKIFLGEGFLDSKRIGEDLAVHFHQRKVKSVEIRKGVTTLELTSFLASAALPPKEIVEKGGLSRILKSEHLACIAVHDLDYSHFLTGAGKDYKDVWFNMLSDTARENDAVRLGELGDAFGDSLEQVDLPEIFDREGDTEAIKNFLAKLKTQYSDKFIKCTKELAKNILRSEKVPKTEGIQGIRQFLNELSGDELADILLAQLQSDKGINVLSFNLFSRLMGEKKKEEFSRLLSKKIENNQNLKNNSQLAERMRKLFTSADSFESPRFYQKNLASILEEMSLGKGVYFDRNKLHDNFRYLLLDLLVFENSLNRLRTILDKFGGELKKAIDDLDEEYIKKYIEVFNKKSKDNPEVIQDFSATNKILGKFVENAIFTGKADLDFEYFLGFLPENSLDIEVYLHYMFNENKINPQVFKVFFKFFPDKVDYFCQKVKTRISDVKFIERIIDSLVHLPSPLALHILIYIYSVANKFLKLESLKAMSNIDAYDRDFLFSILQKSNADEKSLAAAVLVRYPQDREKLARSLLALPNPLGLRSSLIRTNINIVEKLPFAGARPYLEAISRYRFFWNRTIRRRAAAVLRKIKIPPGQKKVSNNE